MITTCTYRGDPAALMSRLIAVVFGEENAIVSPDERGDFVPETWRGKRLYIATWRVADGWCVGLNTAHCTQGVPYDRWNTAEDMVRELQPTAEVLSCSTS